MILKKEFEKREYWDILQQPNQFKISYLYDSTPQGPNIRPGELVAVYMSRYWDELFLILDSAKWDDSIPALCKKWDQKLAAFCNFGSQSKEELRNFRYNMVQIILFSGHAIDCSEEASLRTSRKIILPYYLDRNGQIDISDFDAIEIPFYLVPEKVIGPDPQLKAKLQYDLPAWDSDCAQILSAEYTIPRRQSNVETQPKIFTDEQYQKIKGWLTEHENQ